MSGIENSSILQCVIEWELNAAQDCAETRALATQKNHKFCVKDNGDDNSKVYENYLVE